MIFDPANVVRLTRVSLALLCAILIFPGVTAAQRPTPTGLSKSEGAHTLAYCPSYGGNTFYERIQNVTYHIEGASIWFVIEIYISNPYGCVVGSPCPEYDSEPECVNGWIDWNGDNRWDPAERVMDLALTGYAAINYAGTMTGYAQAQIPATYVAQPNMRVNLGWGFDANDPCEDHWNYGDVQDLSVDLGTYEVTKVTVADGNRVREIADNVIWERTFDGSCNSCDVKVSYDDYPFSGSVKTTVTLRSEISACPTGGDPPKIACDWRVLPISHEGADITGSVPKVTTWTLDVPVKTPSQIGVYKATLAFDITGPNGLVITRTVERKLFVTLQAPLAETPILGIPKRKWYEKACTWGRMASADSIAVHSVRSEEYLYGRARWRYGYYFGAAPKCSWVNLVEDNPCNYSDCYIFSEVLKQMCAVLGIGDFTEKKPAGTCGKGFITVKDVPSIDPEFPGNARQNTGDFDRYFFTSHSLLEKNGIFHDATFNRAYSAETEFISWNVLNDRVTPWTTDEGATLEVFRQREFAPYDSWPLCLYTPPPFYVTLSMPAPVHAVAASSRMLPGAIGAGGVGSGLQFTHTVTYFLIDDDGNGIAEGLAADVEVDILRAGEYVIAGTLDSGSIRISHRPRTETLLGSLGHVLGVPGRYTVRIEFSGEDIYASGLDGPYEARFFASSSSGDEDVLTAATPGYAHTQFGEFLASIQSVSDTGVDLDSDGKFDVLRTSVELMARADKDVAIVGGVRSNSTSLATSSSNFSLTTGTHVVTLDFSGKSLRRAGRNGPYTVVVNMHDSQGLDLSSLEHTTAAYSVSDFDELFLMPTGPFSESVVDTDGDGLFDSLYTMLEGSVESPGTFRIVSWLTGTATGGEPFGPVITTSDQTVTVTEGVTVLRSRFDGAAIRRHGTDGPYMLAQIEVTDTLGAFVDEVSPRCITSPYLATQFEKGPPEISYSGTFQDHVLDTNGNALADSLCVLIEVDSTGDAVLLASADLFDPNGEFVVNGTGQVSASEEVPVFLPILFDGRYIYGNLKDGSFELRNIYVYHSGDVRTGLRITSIGPTGYYEHQQFEPAAVITGFIESASGAPAIGAEARTREFIDYTDAGGRYRLIFLAPDTVVVRASFAPPLSWSIYRNGAFVGAGDSLAVDVEIGVVDTVDFRISPTGVPEGEDRHGRLRRPHLEQNWPNPFNPDTSIAFSLSAESTLLLQVYDVHGHLVRRLVAGTRGAGRHVVTWDGTDDEGIELPSGVYFCRIQIGRTEETRRMAMIR
jgi:hypothetical protein